MGPRERRRQARQQDLAVAEHEPPPTRAIGHVGATLITAAGLWTALRLDTVEHSVVNARDVGSSYGVLAVAAAMTYLLAPRLRVGYALLILAGVVGVAAAQHTFTDFGHLLAALLGFACYGLVRGRSTGACLANALELVEGRDQQLNEPASAWKVRLRACV